jgi:hypothetical protein
MNVLRIARQSPLRKDFENLGMQRAIVQVKNQVTHARPRDLNVHGQTR